MIRTHGLDVCYFLETWISEPSLHRVWRFMGPQSNIYMLPSQRLLGCIIVIWRKSMGQLSLIHMNRQAIFGVITPNHQQSWFIRFVHASTCGIKRKNLWMLAQAILGLYLPTLPIGDFNCILMTLISSVEDLSKLPETSKSSAALFNKWALLILATEVPIILGAIISIVMQEFRKD